MARVFFEVESQRDFSNANLQDNKHEQVTK